MSLIIVEGRTIETKEIFAIEEAGRRFHGFTIRMIDKPDIFIGKKEQYDMDNWEKREINGRYRNLREEVRKQWEADKTELKVFKL